MKPGMLHSQRGQFQFDRRAAHIWRCIVHSVGDDHLAASVRTDQAHQMLRMIAHPKRRQVQPHNLPPTRAQVAGQFTLMQIGRAAWVTSRCYRADAVS